MSDPKKPEVRKISRRQMLRMTAFGSAGLVMSSQLVESVMAAGRLPLKSVMAQDKINLRVQADESLEKPVGDLFIAAHPEVGSIEYLNVTGIDHEEVASKILSMVAAGTPIDLGFACTEATELYAGNGLSTSITDRVKADAAELADYFKDVHPALIEAMLYKGDLYQLAQNFNAANMYFNTKLVHDAGMEVPGEDWTKDDFYALAKAITKKNGNDTEVFGYGWTNRLWGSWMPWIFVNDGGLLTEEKFDGGEWLWDGFYKGDAAAAGRGGGYNWAAPQANHPNNVEALEFVVQLAQEGIAPAIELGGGDSLQGFFTGDKLGMTVGGGFWAGGLHNAGMAPDAFQAQFWPKWKSQRHQFGVCAKFLFKGSEHADLGWEYLKHEVSLDAMNVHGYFNPYIITTPARRSMLTAERFAETGPTNWKVFYDTLDKHPDTAPIPAPPKSNPMTTIFTKYTSIAMTFEQSPKDALDAMQKDLEDLFARA